VTERPVRRVGDGKVSPQHTRRQPRKLVAKRRHVGPVKACGDRPLGNLEKHVRDLDHIGPRLERGERVDQPLRAVGARDGGLGIGSVESVALVVDDEDRRGRGVRPWPSFTRDDVEGNR